MASNEGRTKHSSKSSGSKKLTPIFPVFPFSSSFSRGLEDSRLPWTLIRGYQQQPMTGRGRFQVSTSEQRPGASTILNIPQVHRLQQQLRVAGYEEEDDERKVVLGICAMEKKSISKPMNEIIQRLVGNFERLQVLVFDEDTILNKPVEDWPVVNGLVSFFSHGFPLDKAIAYKDLRQPFVVNDLEMQYVLQDRRKVYSMMKENSIPCPRYAVLERDRDSDCVVSETEDSIEVNGTLFMKPFVEKPVDAEDHNVYIYFPVAAGGGSTRLFRKVKDRSSVYSRFCRVRSKGSYLYEDFMPTDGTDVKVYTVGPDYQHAEARKSPALDGKVERDSEGKEIRYPVLLSNREKMIARSVCKVFKQNVCGFDLLRANGQHYVCDVNGFSFVKTSSKYYDDCAKILGTLVMRACCPQLQIPYPLCTAPEDIPVVQTTSGSMMELRCVIAVIRHGDRTPKQKMKMEVKNKMFFDLFEKYGGFKSGHLKLKKPKQLQEVLDIVRLLLAEGQSYPDQEVEEKRVKLNQLKLVLEMYGHFSGFNRKVQLKYQPQGRPKRSSSEEDEAPRAPSLVLILKWGGELTPAGRIQAENLGKAFRTLYPGGQGQFEAPGLGFLRLHSTFRHDLKIYASDEGRVQMTAAAFTKGLLALEGELTPIVVQMVKSANTNGLLDSESNTSKYQIVVKEKLKEIFNQDRDFTEDDHLKLASTNSIALVNAMEFVKNPYQMCVRVHEMIREITGRIRCLKMELKSREQALFNGESWELLIRRWAKLEKDFRLKNGRFDISKIPDIYDCIKYDLQHNQKTLQFKRAQELFMCSKALADIIVPQEYGITVDEKLHIGQNYCTPLLRKIRCDLLQCVTEPCDDSTTRLDSKYSNGVASPERFVRTRLYFTSESHIHSLLAMLRYGGFLSIEQDEQWKRSMDFVGACAELNYMSQIVIMMFEDPAKDENSDDRFHIELHFSPGAYTSCDEMGSEPKGMGFRPKPSRDQSNSQDITTPTQTVEGGGSSSRIDESQMKIFPGLSETESIETKLPEQEKHSSINQSSSSLCVQDIPASLPAKTEEPNPQIEAMPMQEREKTQRDAPFIKESDRKTNITDACLVQDVESTQSQSIIDCTLIQEQYHSSQTSMNLLDSDRGNLSSPACCDPSRETTPFAANSNSSRDTSGRDREIQSLQYNVPPHASYSSRSEKCDYVRVTASQSLPTHTAGDFNDVADPEIFSDDPSSVKGSFSYCSAVGRSRFEYKPHSPDPNTPEWDWGDEEQQATATANTVDRQHQTVGADKKSKKVKIQNPVTERRQSSSQTSHAVLESELHHYELEPSRKQDSVNMSCSLPKNIEHTWGQREERQVKLERSCSDEGREGTKTKHFTKTSPIEINASSSLDPLKPIHEEKRSRSLEDGTLDITSKTAAFQRNYRTIHLPLSNDVVFRPLSNFFYLHQSPKALEGFSNVPLLQPLETLHNNLTFHQVDDFLGRVTTNKFPIPDPTSFSSLFSKTGLTINSGIRSQDLPSSSNSSGGPNSPNYLAPTDLLKTLGLYIRPNDDNSISVEETDYSHSEAEQPAESMARKREETEQREKKVSTERSPQPDDSLSNACLDGEIR